MRNARGSESAKCAIRTRDPQWMGNAGAGLAGNQRASGTGSSVAPAAATRLPLLCTWLNFQPHCSDRDKCP